MEETATARTQASATNRLAALAVVASLPIAGTVGYAAGVPYVFLIVTPVAGLLLGPLAWPGSSGRRLLGAVLTFGAALLASAVTAVAIFLGALTFFTGSPVGALAEVIAPVVAVFVYAAGGMIVASRPGPATLLGVWPLVCVLAVAALILLMWVAVWRGAGIEP